MTPPDEPGRLETIGERYMLVDRIAADERREVWRGHDDLTSRPVAITRFLDATPEWRTRFDRRARALAVLSDPGIASTLRHDAHDTHPWVATAWVEGESVATIEATDGFTADDALAVVGQTALALAGAHAAGIGHGGLDASSIIVRPDGSVALIGFALDAEPAPAADRPALAAVARDLLASDPASVDPQVARLLERMGRAGAADDDLLDIGRTALALAIAQRGETSLAAVPPAGDPDAADAEPARRPWYDEAERKRVRNRLIALGAIVVIGGAALLRIFSSGAGQATVPSVIGLPFAQAQHQLNEVGFRANETLTTGPVGSVGTVIAQDPPGGTRTKVGTLIQLTVATSETG
ncbi:MAG TPA: PASTA domain-containing protein [Mycobacteriales bacterium]|nr:PASTA domain-containing protein [Mycobacteriales bacterium]